jgi:hypothetical protein
MRQARDPALAGSHSNQIMKTTRGLIGRSIVGIQQSPIKLSSGRKIMTLDWIELSDGTRLIPAAYQTDDRPVGDLLLDKSKRQRK